MFWCELCQGRLTQQSGHVDLCTEVYGVPPRASDHLASGGPPVRPPEKDKSTETAKKVASEYTLSTVFVKSLNGDMLPSGASSYIATPSNDGHLRNEHHVSGGERSLP